MEVSLELSVELSLTLLATFVHLSLATRCGECVENFAEAPGFSVGNFAANLKAKVPTGSLLPKKSPPVLNQGIRGRNGGWGACNCVGENGMLVGPLMPSATPEKNMPPGFVF